MLLVEDGSLTDAVAVAWLVRMEVVAIEHENSILELKEKNQKLKKKLASAEETAGDRADECKNLAVRLAVRG
jgi:precorrin-6B methylase 2